jgi:putative flippase GtrA
MTDASTAQRRRVLSGQLLRYAFVGVVSNLSGYAAYLLLTFFGATPKITMTSLYLVGATTGFLGNSKLTFAWEGSFVGSSVRYAAAHAIGYALDFAMLSFFVDKLRYPHQFVQFAAVVVVAAYLFVAFKYFVFPQPRAL